MAAMASNGLETVWVMVALLLAAIAYLRGDERGLSVSSSFLVLMRSDLIWVPVMLSVFRRDLKLVKWPLLTLLSVTAFRTSYFGSPVPLSYLERSDVAVQWGVRYGFPFLALVAAYFAPFWSKLEKSNKQLVLLCIVFVLLYGLASVVQGGRYLIYVFPLLYLVFLQSKKLGHMGVIWLLLLSVPAHITTLGVRGIIDTASGLAVKYGVNASTYAGVAYFADGNFFDASGLHSQEAFRAVAQNDSVLMYHLVRGRTTMTVRYSSLESHSGDSVLYHAAREYCVPVGWGESPPVWGVTAIFEVFRC